MPLSVMYKQIWIYLLILLLQLGELIEIKMIGTISVAGIIYICWFFLYVISGVWYSEINSSILRRVTILYLLLLVFQITSEVIVGNDFNNAIKGVAVTILSYAKLVCLWPLVMYDSRRIKWLFICMVISGTLSFQFLSDKEFHVDYLLNGTEYSVFKFMIAPLFGELLVVCSLLKYGDKYVTWLSLVIGALCAILGARSTGLMIFLTGVIVLVVNHMKGVITKGQILTWSLVSALVLYGFFALYVTAVLNGSIVGGNSKDQFTKVENPYNPIYVLLSGRTESPSSIAAIKDRPLTGFGAWAKDPNLKYHKIQAKAQGMMLVVRDDFMNIIPAHSVVLQTGVHEGIFAMGMMISILWFFVKKGAQSLRKDCVYNYLVIYCIMQLIWHGLFSPVKHFSNNFPIFFCCCLFAYRQHVISKLSKRYESNHFGINGYSWRKRVAKKND